MGIDPHDVEQSLLRQRLLPLIGHGDVPSLIDLTRIAAEAIEEDLRSILEVVGSEAPGSPRSVSSARPPIDSCR